MYYGFGQDKQFEKGYDITHLFRKAFLCLRVKAPGGGNGKAGEHGPVPEETLGHGE